MGLNIRCVPSNPSHLKPKNMNRRVGITNKFLPITSRDIFKQAHAEPIAMATIVADNIQYFSPNIENINQYHA